MPERTLVVSATNVLARGFLLVPTDRASRAGEPVNGLYAVARAIQRVLTFKRPARAVAIVEDGVTLAPPILAAQVAPLPGLLRALGMHVVTATGELDLVASYVRAAREAGDDAIIVGVDKRFAQLVSDRVWWYDANKDARYTPEIVHKRFGVGPERVAQWLALVGDEDQLPGIASIGAKGATTLLEQYGSIDEALAHVDEIKGRLGNALRAARGDAIAAERTRATLDATRPLPVPLDQLTFTEPAVSELNQAFDRLGFAELLVADGGQFRCELAEAALPPLGGTIALHAVIEDDGTLVGIALATAARGDEGSAWYVPRASAAWPELVRWLEDPAAPKIGHDLVGTIVALRGAGVTLAGIAGDSAVASHLTQPSNWAPHDLALVAKHVLGRALPDDETLRGVGQKRKPWGALPAERTGGYAGLCADTSGALWQALAPGVAEANVQEYLALGETLVRMELCGLVVEPTGLDRAEQAFAAIDAELTAQIEQLAGHTFNINSTKQLGTVLFEELKLPVASHTKTGWSTSTEALEKIEHAHPIVPLVIRWRLLRRLRDSWVVALHKHIHADGRVHSHFHLARSFSGELVNTAPDLGRVPGRTPEMAMIRRAFVAPPGHLLMSVDFNQLGLYVLAHLTKDPALVGPLRERADMHRLTAAAVLEKPANAITTDERQLGKVVNFATFAGQGASALALQLGVPAAEAKEYIARFDRRYALVRAFQDEQLRLAKERGYITTIAGRHWPIGGLESLDSHDRSYAERLARRATHEGSVADVSRRALLDADRALRTAGLAAQPVVQVVDEVLFQVPEHELAEAARIASTAMREAFAPLEVPLVVGVEAGPNWADLEPVSSGV
jgi:DNA polymerase-1